MVGKMTNLIYAPLFLFQLILLILFVCFVRYGDASGASVRGFEDTHVMIFIGFAYLMTFLKKYCYSALGFNWLLAALSIQWALFCQGAFEWLSSHHPTNTIFISKKSLLEADIMSATVLITFGALLGLASGTQLLFISFIEIAAGCGNLYILNDLLKVGDIGGSIGIHTFGAYFGLAVSTAMRMKKTTEAPPPNPEPLDKPNYASDISAMIGSIFLWIYWPSFNSALATTNDEYQRAVINTYLSLASCTVTTFVMSAAVHHGKLDMVHIQNSTLAGGVAVGAVANMYIGPGVALAIGIGAGILSVLGYKHLSPRMESCGIQDTCGVNNLHGMPGIYSGLLSVLFSALSSAGIYGNDWQVSGQGDGIGNDTISEILVSTTKPIVMEPTSQLAGMGTTLGIAIGAGLIAGLIAKTSIFSPLKVKERYDDELNWELP